ncbi:MAG: Zn-dependent hydrolase [Gemmatimonadales bacterium]
MKRRDFNRLMLGATGTLAFPGLRTRFPNPQYRVNGERLNRLMREQAEFGKTAAGGVSRLAYSKEDLAVRAYVMDQMRQAGLQVTIDAGGNILGRRDGTDESLPPILFGSHVDSVPDGGAYDGNVGSFSALEVAWTISERGIATRHPIEVVVFQNEEGGLYGSEAMAGSITPEELAGVSLSGKTIAEGIEILGGDPTNLEAARRGKGDIAAYLELHIEQGGLLEAAGIQIGVVEGIVGISQWDVTVEGFANHAGTTPMDQRKDALLAAARFIQAVNRVVTGVPGRQVGTVGQIEVWPGAPNVIPGRVELSLELRDLDRSKIAALYETIHAEGERIAQASGTRFAFVDRRLGIVPQPTDETVRRVIDRAADELGLSHQRMPSGAGHDAQSLAPIAPIGMIFIPSAGGISHSPREFSRPEDIVNGANVLLNAVLALDEEL